MTLDEKRAEFFANLWDHSRDPFQMQFDERRRLSRKEMKSLRNIHAAILATQDDAVVAKTISDEIKSHGSVLTALTLQLCGLTRTKIITDLKASGYEGSVPSSYECLHTSASWEVSGRYLARRLRSVFAAMPKSYFAAYEALNQATYPGFIRQERAKRQGHEAEYRLARLLADLQLPFEPREKADNPLCRDAAIHGISFDIVVPEEAHPLLLFKCTVHTSNIGQYGESKDHLEMNEARSMIRERYALSRQPTLMALIDGIGFRSNAAGLNGVLDCADEFCQFSTLWKAGIVAAHRLGHRALLYAPRSHTGSFLDFLTRYRESVKVVGAKPEGAVSAGAAFLSIQKS